MIRLRIFIEDIYLRTDISEQVPKIYAEEWDDYEAAVRILKLPYITTLRMQNHEYTPSEFYGDWQNLLLELESVSNNQLAADLLLSMKRRQTGLIDSPVVLASVFIDPRYRVLLSERESTIAIDHILQLRHRLTDCGSQKTTPGPSQTVDDSVPDLTAQPSCDSNYTSIDRMRLVELISKRTQNNPFYRQETGHAEFVRSILYLPLETDINMSPFEYWAGRKKMFPEIYKIHLVVNAAAPTQTSVERAFSGLSYVLSSHRTRLSPRMLSNLLILRLNADMWKSSFYLG